MYVNKEVDSSIIVYFAKFFIFEMKTPTVLFYLDVMTCFWGPQESVTTTLSKIHDTLEANFIGGFLSLFNNL